MATKKNTSKNNGYWSLPGFIRNRKSRFVFNAGFNSARMYCDNKIDDMNPSASDEQLSEMKKATREMSKWAKLVQPAKDTKKAYRPIMEPKQILKAVKCLKGYEPFNVLMRAANLGHTSEDNDNRWAIARDAFNKYFDKATYFGDNEESEQPKQESKPEPKPKKQAAKKKGNGTSKKKAEPKPQPPVENTKEDKIMNMLQQMAQQMANNKAENDAAIAALSERIGD